MAAFERLPQTLLIAIAALALSSCAFFDPQNPGEVVNSVLLHQPDGDFPLTLPATIDLPPEGGVVRLDLSVDALPDHADRYVLIRNHQCAVQMQVNGMTIQEQGDFPPNYFLPIGRYLVFRIPGQLLGPATPVRFDFFADSPRAKIEAISIVGQAEARFYENAIGFLNTEIYRYFAFLCLFIFIYSLVQWIQRLRDLDSLYFSLFNLFIGAYYVGLGQSWHGVAFLPFLALFKGSLFLASAALLVFCLSLVGKRLRGLNLAIWIVGAAAFAAMLAGAANSNRVNNLFRVFLFLADAEFLAAFVIVLRKFLLGQHELRPLVAGGGVALAAGAIDSVAMLSGHYTLFWLQGFGIFVFLISVFLSLVGRTTRMHAELEGYARGIQAEVERRTAELNASNLALTRASQAKSDFLAHMSHEIRTPLNCIMGFAQILEQHSAGSLDRYYSGLILRESGHLMQLIVQILDLSRIEHGKLVLETAPFDLLEAFDSVLEGFAQSAGAKGLRVERRLDPGLPAAVGGDQLRFQQILINLIGNAIKFTQSGSVSVEARAAGHKHGRVRVEVAIGDTGIGIAADKLESIFNRFEQADTSITRKYGGTGLGITIARDLIELMDGDIRIASVPGQGTEVAFGVWFGLADAAALPRPPAAGAAAEPTAFPPGFAVLVVDDYFTNLEVVRVFLERAGVGMVEAKSGPEALEQFKRHGASIAAALMDIHMPDMDGWECARQIRELPGGKDLPIIALTADAFGETAAKAAACGLHGILTKPLQYKDLMAALRPLADRTALARVQSPPPPEAGDGEEIIDSAYLAEAYFGDETITAQLLGLFAETGKVLLEELREALLTVAVETVHLKAHALKGGALNVGAKRLAAAALAVERLAKQRETAAAAAAFEAVERAWAEFAAEFGRRYRR